jgi:hypothetical protein
MASTFDLNVAMERVTRRFIASNVSAGKVLPASYRLIGPVVDCVMLMEFYPTFHTVIIVIQV